MRRLVSFLIISLYFTSAHSQSSLVFTSQESLELGSIVDRFSLLPIGQCPVERIFYNPNSVMSDGQFSQPLKPENLEVMLKNATEVNYQWLNKIRHQAMQGDFENPLEFNLRFQGGLRGPLYQSDINQDCLLNSDLEGLVTELELGAHFYFDVKIVFKNLVDRHRALNYYKLNRSNLFSLFIKLAEMDIVPTQLTLGLRQTGGNIRTFMDLIDDLQEKRLDCSPGNYSPCQEIVTSLYEYIFQDRGLEQQLLEAHQQADDTFQSTRHYTMELSDQLSDHSNRLQRESKKTLIQLLKTQNEVNRLVQNQLHFNRYIVKDIVEILRVHIAQMDLYVEHCFENWLICNLNWESLQQDFQIVSKDLWIDADFIKACELDGDHPFFIGLVSRYQLHDCGKMWSFLKSKSTLDARDLGMWSVHYLKFFPNIKSIDVRETHLHSLDGLEHLPLLSTLTLDINHDVDYFWLQVTNPNLVIQTL